MNKVRDYRALEREYISGDMSLRALCRRHRIGAHSALMRQAKKRDWAKKRARYRERASTTYIEARADRVATREAEIRDNALEAIDETITRLRVDLRATKRVKQPDGSIGEEPLLRIRPRDLAMLIDRFSVLFGHPSTITEERSLNLAAEIPVESLRSIVDATRGLADTPTVHESPLPRAPLD